MTDTDHRPSPDALLKEAGQAGRGRLKIFLGAAPGVGKTYEMLVQARRRKLDGVDAVIGVVETHGRVETDLLTKGIETIPKRRMLYKGRVLAEMDLDAILQRRPRLVLVDELAHDNAPGSRHPKRYLDVEELLTAGIDVYSTLNVQHVESLNDVVAQITKVRVRETVPDSILDRADDIELVDLTPEDLLQRLKDGKVYLPAAAERAQQNYFVPGNLAALRELALRRTAQRVDAQMVDYMRAHAIAGPWEASERLLVAVNDRPGAAMAVRYARRLADRLRASWTAVHVETGHSQGEMERDRVAQLLRLAERMGGMAATVPAAGEADGVLQFARANNITHIVITASRRSRWLDLLRPSSAQQIIRQAGDISVHVVPERGGKEDIAKAPAPERTPLEPRAFAASLLFSALALGFSLLLRQTLAVSNVALVLLVAVLVSAVSYGLLPSLFAGLVCALAYNFFFLPPLYTFTIANPENVITLLVFVLVAAIASNLTARVRMQAIVARQRAATTEDLYRFSRKLAGIATLDDLLWATAYQVAHMLKLHVVLLMPDEGSLQVRAGYPPEDTLDQGDLAAAKWAFEQGHEAGRGADTLPGARRLFLPMRTARGVVAIIGLDSERTSEPANERAGDSGSALLTPDQRRLLDSLSDQTALAIERLHLADEMDRSRVAAETEKLRTALLTSISHDLRTPLASILGSASSLKQYRGQLGEADQAELLRTIQEEAERLNHFIANLLDMTRLESGALIPNMDLIELGDVVGSVLRRAPVKQHSLVLDVEPGLPMLRLDPVLFEQVLFNLLDNAAKYAAPATTITLRARRAGAAVTIQLLDEGPGLPDEDRERIFDKFYRVRVADKKRAGTGLGLAIARGFMEAMGGTITAANRGDRSGAVFTLLLPVPIASEIEKNSAMNRLRILIVDDEPPIRRFLRTALAAQDYRVEEARDGESALDFLKRNVVDLIILDLGLPGMDGLEVVRRLRQEGAVTPIVILSSRDDEAGKVAALDLGADDYVSKPFGVEELSARVRAALRHRLQQAGEKPVFKSGDLSMDVVRRIVTARGEEVKLTPREYDLLRLMVSHAGKVLTHKFILKEVWGGETDVQYLRIYIRTLRQKLEADPEQPKLILTEQGVGYRLRAAD